MNIKARRVIPSDTNGFLSAVVSQVNVNKMKRNFEQRSKLRVAKCLMFHVVSSNYNVSSLELRKKKKTTQQWNLRVATDIVLRQVYVQHERKYADIVVSKFWFVRSFCHQHHSKFITNITSEKVSQVRTKKCKTISFSLKVNLRFLSSSRHLN